MRFWKPYLTWAALGLVGVVFVAWSVDLALMSSTPGMQSLSPAALRLVAAIQPAALVLIGTAMGVSLAHRVGFRSWLTARLRNEAARFPSPWLPVISGFTLGVAVALADLLFFLWSEESRVESDPISLMERLMALTYGGISEELVMRYGLMSFIVWLGIKVTGRDRPGPALVWSALLVVAVLFGAGHLPVMAQLAPLTLPIVLRTIVLNAAVGVLAGWLYWRRGLEAAMLAHAAAHPGMWLVLAVAV